MRSGRIWASLLAIIALVASPLAATPAMAAPPKLSVEVASTATTVDTGARLSYSLKVECSNLIPGDCVQPVITLPVPQSADGSVVAHSPEVEEQWVESAELNTAGDAYVITLGNMKPGDTRLLTQSWLIDNYTTPNGVDLDMADPTITFTDENGAPQTGTLTGGPDTVTTHAERIVTVNKTMVNPSYADRVKAGDDVTYRVNAYIPAGTNGTIGIQKVVMVDTFDADATVVDAAGGTVSGNTITWEIDIDPAQQPLGAANSIVARDVTLHYPASMQPAVDSGQTREVVNKLDATVDFIDGGQETGSGQQEHAFIGPASAPSGSLHTEPRISAMNHAANGFDTAVLNNDSTTEWSYTLDGWWRDIPNEGWVQRPEYTRNLFVAHRMACWDPSANDGEGQWLAPQIGTEGGNATNVFLYFNRPNAFANHGDLAPWLAQPEVEQCQSPGFKLDRIDVDDMGAPSEGWNGGARRGDKVAAINVAYWDTATNSGGTTQLLTPGGLHDSTVEVYGTAGARNLGLSSTQTVTDIVVFYEALMQREGQSRDGDGGGSGAYVEEDRTNKVKLWGTSTQAFVDSDRTSQSLRATSFVSHQRDADGEPSAGGNANYNVVWQTALRAGSTVMNFNRFFTDLEVSKTALSDVSAVKPGDTLRWEVKAGLGDANGTQLVTPKVIDVLPVGLEYVPGSTAIDHPSTSEPVSVEPEIGTVEIDGVERQTLTWEFDERFQPGDEATISFDTTVTLAAAAGAHSGDESQAVYVFDTEGPLNLLGSGIPTDTYDLDGDGDTTEHVGKASRDWTVAVASGATIEKFVNGSQGADLGVANDPSIGDSEWTKAGVSAATTDTSGTWVDYRLDVSNNGTQELFDTVVYDVLPHSGDTAIGAALQGEARESDFEVTFRELVDALPDGVSVEYSTSNNPPRPELFEGTGVTQDGATGEWTSTLPADPTTVRALKYTIDSLVPGQTLQLSYRADIPVYEFGASHPAQQTGDDTEYAWNNLAFRTNNNEGPLLAAEAPKVSIRSILGEIGDYAWFDTNNNGVQDAGEQPAPGVVFQLVDADGNDVVDVNGDPVTATTNENGEYSFEVPLGTWAVKVVEIPEDYALAQANAGDDDEKDSDATALNVATEPVTITKDHLVDHSLDAGLVGVVSVGDFVWLDTNRDGVQDAGEPGIEGVELTLTGPDGQPVTDVNGDPVVPVRTEADGSYTFENLPALEGDQSYTVTVTDPPANTVPTRTGQGDRGTDSSTGQASTDNAEIDLTEAGARDDTLDFGFIGVVSVGDYVWSDTDNNGVQDAGEPGIPGVTLTLTGPDGQPVTDVNGNPVEPVVTGPNGEYLFENLPALSGDETYTVTVTPPDGYQPAKTGQGDRGTDSSTGTAVTDNDEIDLSEPGARDDTLDFGFVPTVSVGDFVWLDTDEDGVQDAGEPGIPGVTLTLTGPDGQPVTDVNGNPVEPVVTGPNGEYLFENLPVLGPDERYTVTVTPPNGYEPTLPGVGDRETDSSTGSATTEGLTNPGDEDRTLDFGFIPQVPVIDIEKYDTDGNDADTAEESVVLPDGSTELRFTVTNLGNEELVNIEVSDTIIDGTGKVDGLVCTFPDGSTGTSWAGPFTPSASFDCEATLTGVEPGTTHLDRATVKGEGRWSGTPVTDEDDYNGHTPNPSIDIEKIDLEGNDADTERETVRTKDDTRKIKMIITNTGDEALKDVSVTDKVTRGGAKVENIVCTFPDGSTGTTWAGPFEPGDSFECTATITGLKIDDLHANNSTVKGTGVDSGKEVSDEDPYHVIRTGDLAITGGAGIGLGVLAAGLLLLAGGALVLYRRKAGEVITE
ncbi:SdrD B-like domain-containing protein [Microbacterium sp. NPDC078428]|uniref:SdrD B-like domain-containing protein n=1 Tax=Microbacterium sp. NPDC078428 TaxID=3364190 RepID=UPI0037C72A74